MKESFNFRSKEWDDFIFQDKNKSYGAYKLRQKSSIRHILAFMLTLIFTIVIVILIAIADSSNVKKENIEDTYVPSIINYGG